MLCIGPLLIFYYIHFYTYRVEEEKRKETGDNFTSKTLGPLSSQV